MWAGFPKFRLLVGDNIKAYLKQFMETIFFLN